MSPTTTPKWAPHVGVLPSASSALLTRTELLYSVPVSGDTGAYPDWGPTVERELLGLTRLATNWDSYGAPQISAEVATELAALLMSLGPVVRTAPLILPDTNGGVAALWRNGTFSVELHVDEQGMRSVFATDGARPFEWEGPPEQASSLREWVFQASGTF